jgi:hypothetical protein
MAVLYAVATFLALSFTLSTFNSRPRTSLISKSARSLLSKVYKKFSAYALASASPKCPVISGFVKRDSIVSLASSLVFPSKEVGSKVNKAFCISLDKLELLTKFVRFVNAFPTCLSSITSPNFLLKLSIILSYTPIVSPVAFANVSFA